MGQTTAISWTNHTFNPWIGCTKVSVGFHGACEGCYAEVATPTRALGVSWGNHPRHRTAPSNWRQPIKWNRQAEGAEERPFVFCASLADVFDNQVDPQWRRDLFDLIHATPNLMWLLLTKRPQNIVKLFRECIDMDQTHDSPADYWPINAAIGCTVVTQAEADRDIPVLLRAKQALRPAFAFLSMEPLMGPVDIRPWIRDLCPNCHQEGCVPSLRADSAEVFSRCGAFVMETPEPAIGWVITGGETDQGSHRARPSHPDWFRSLRDQCAAAGVPFHFKQWGDWVGGEVYSKTDEETGYGHRLGGFARHQDGEEHRGKVSHWWSGDSFDGVISTRAGKKVTGRLLDGQLHDARPK